MHPLHLINKNCLIIRPHQQPILRSHEAVHVLSVPEREQVEFWNNTNDFLVGASVLFCKHVRDVNVLQEVFCLTGVSPVTPLTRRRNVHCRLACWREQPHCTEKLSTLQ